MLGLFFEVMMKIYAFAACFVFALVFSCADYERDNPYDPKGSKYDPSLLSSSDKSSSSSSIAMSSSSDNSSSSANESSSSSVAMSSSSDNSSSSAEIPKCGTVEYDPKKEFCDSRKNDIYKWIKIGEQIWMAENLNYDTTGSISSTYGRLYNWATAMSACPSGWHIPDGTEWNTLITEVGGFSNVNEKLKATSGWNGSSGNGQDTYGFSAQPDGYYDGSLKSVGNTGMWWSSIEDDEDAYHLYISYYFNANYRKTGKSLLISVRCLQD